MGRFGSRGFFGDRGLTQSSQRTRRAQRFFGGIRHYWFGVSVVCFGQLWGRFFCTLGGLGLRMGWVRSRRAEDSAALPVEGIPSNVIAESIAHAGGAFDEVEEVVFFVFEEEDAAAAAGGFWVFRELNAAGLKLGAGAFDGINAQRDVAPTRQAVIGGFVDVGVSGIDFKDGAARQAEEERRWVFGVGVEEFGVEGVDIPVAQGGGVAGGEPEVFEGKNHFDCGLRIADLSFTLRYRGGLLMIEN
jgi:hypothetical protein